MKEAPIARPRPKVRAWWLKQLHSWHSWSAAVSLVGMLLFAVTGLTLNHAASIGASPRVTDHAATVPAPLLRLLGGPHPRGAPLPDAVALMLRQPLGLDIAGRPAEWEEDAVTVSLPGPGRDAWVSIDRASGRATSELTERGWVSYLNDLHKGRNTGPAWFWFIDIFAVACILFTGTGLVLLQMHARHRRATWPLVGLGLAAPALVTLLLIH